jgi:predicted nuclease of restriction endonuclease-like (RecB) superfamily
VEQLARQLPNNQTVPSFALIPWWHNVIIIEQVKNIEEAIFYINSTIENNWSRAVLEYQIETNLYKRKGNTKTNFSLTLPEPDGDLANAIVKSEYNFEFLRMSDRAKETDLEIALVNHMAQFLTELGKGFAYMGRQFPIKVGSKEYRLDLLFYHTKLKCYIVIELKAKEFSPEFTGQLGFYVTIVDELIKDSTDKPTIGIMLCKNKEDIIVDFALKSINKPIGVSTLKYSELSDAVKEAIPTINEMQEELLKYERKLLNSDNITKNDKK